MIIRPAYMLAGGGVNTGIGVAEGVGDGLGVAVAVGVGVVGVGEIVGVSVGVGVGGAMGKDVDPSVDPPTCGPNEYRVVCGEAWGERERSAVGVCAQPFIDSISGLCSVTRYKYAVRCTGYEDSIRVESWRDRNHGSVGCRIELGPRPANSGVRRKKHLSTCIRR